MLSLDRQMSKKWAKYVIFCGLQTPHRWRFRRR